FLVMCFDRVFDDRVNQQMLKIWDRMNDKGLTSSEKQLNRSDSKQCHFGVWEHYFSFPRVTVDSRTQNRCVETALDEFLTLLGKMVTPRMNNLFAHDRVLSFPSIQHSFAARPSLDFQGLFFTLAVKEGGSQILHLDWLDHPWTYAWVIFLGEGWEGGELCLPQLGRKIPTHPGQVIAFTGCTLAHFAAPHKNSRRLVCTRYSD
ncbi:hypothetical protein K439DRAFT_1245508, partial [Ramaria rubella]